MENWIRPYEKEITYAFSSIHLHSIFLKWLQNGRKVWAMSSETAWQLSCGLKLLSANIKQELFMQALLVYS